MLKIRYACSVCEKEHVKLWRPYMDTAPLICAECAEKRQSPREYDERIWQKTTNGHTATPTGNKLPLPKWTVDEKGRVPSYDGPGPEGTIPVKTDHLLVDISDISQSYTSKCTDMVPAIPDDDGEYWGCVAVPEYDYKCWCEKPTR